MTPHKHIKHLFNKLTLEEQRVFVIELRLLSMFNRLSPEQQYELLAELRLQSST